LSGNLYGSQVIHFYENGEISSIYKGKGKTLGLIPYIRYYLPVKSFKHKFYGQLGLGASLSSLRRDGPITYNVNREIQSEYNGLSSNKVFSGEALLGYHYMISEGVALNTSIGYKYSQSSIKDNGSYTEGGVTIDYEEYVYNQMKTNLVWKLGFLFILH
jgi:hypothetical protein